MFSETLARALSQDLAIDLGTANTLVFLRGVGIIIDEPSIVAIHDADHSVVAVAHARAHSGRFGR